jgi:hypothetical protein
MRNRWIKMCLVAAAGLLINPATDRVRAEEPWDVSGNQHPTGWSPLGPYQHDGSGFYTGIEFVLFNQPRYIGKQPIAVRGLVDSAGLLSGTPGQFLGSGEVALTTEALGRTGWSPGSRLTFGYRLENGWNFSVSWLHLFDTSYTGGAGMQGPDFSNPGFNLENTFLFSPVHNFSSAFQGPVARVTTSDGIVVFGALNGIWNGATDMTMKFTQRFDNWDLAGRFPVFETENARSYAIAGGRFSWIWERFEWRTNTMGFDVVQQVEGAPVQYVESSEWAARYENTLSQRMYGPMIGCGHEVYLCDTEMGSFGAGVEVTGSLLVDIAKQRAKYIREDERTQAKRSWTQNEIVPNVNLEFNMTWQPKQGLTFKVGWNAYNYFNTLYMAQPVGFDVGALDPAYEKKAYRLLHGCNFGVGYVW